MLCGNYEITINHPQLDINQYPLPKPDQFHMLNDGQKFSKSDLSEAYMQVDIIGQLLEASAPAIFHNENNAGWNREDNITVIGPDDKTHVERLEKILQRLKAAGFRLKRSKSEFLKAQMEFLGPCGYPR
ncbi:hypothetical protein COOONC_07739 [Cooperia oncophora]